MTLKEKIKLMQQLKMFSAFNEEELAVLAIDFHYKKFKANEIIIHRNQAKKELFIVISGKIISTLKLPDKLERQHSEFLPGEFFGEMALLEDSPRSAYARTAEESELVVISKESFQNLIHSDPGVTSKILFHLLHVVCKR